MIRNALPEDFAQMLPVFREVIAGGDTYAFDTDTTDEEAFAYWFGKGVKSFVYEENGRILGFYKIIANQRGRGSHVANASFMVSSQARHRGLGKKLGEDCLMRAKEMGFRAMQFNFVISTNEPAVRLWKSLGFREIGRIPQGFRHKELDYVDALILFREL